MFERSRARLSVLCLVALSVGGCVFTLPQPPSVEIVLGPRPQRFEPPRLVVLAWDGAADWMVDRLLAEGQLPHLADLAARGFAAEHSVTSFPSKTAAGHATLWTGCWPSVHGVTANRVPLLPRAEHTLLESASGYLSEALRAEPLYVTAALAGRKVAVLSATQNYPADPWVEQLRRRGLDPSRFVSLSGFEHEVARGAMVEAEIWQPVVDGSRWAAVPGAPNGRREAVFRVGETTFHALAFDSPDDPTSGLDRVLVRRVGEPGAGVVEATLRPLEASDPLREAEAPDADDALWSPPFEVDGGAPDVVTRPFTRFRLFRLTADGSDVALYHRNASALDGHAHGEDLEGYRGAYPDFHDVAFYGYEAGLLGLPLPDGGDGTAEARLLEIVRDDMERLGASARWALEDFEADVLFHYTPMIDAAGHTWLGLLDPTRPGHDPAVAERIEPLYEAVYRAADRWLGEVVAAAGPNTVVAVVSDHGMAPTHRDFHPNSALEEAGLLTRGLDGGIDLARTKVLAPAFGFFFLNVNHTGWRDGVVPPAEIEGVLQAAEEVLRSVRDPETGRLVVNRTFRAAEAPGLGLGGEAGGDLYFDLVPGYYADARLTDRAVTDARSPWGRGGHGFWPERRDMHAIFYAGGPGLGDGETIPPVRHVDVAPTLARAVGLPPPADACGHAAGGLPDPR